MSAKKDSPTAEADKKNTGPRRGRIPESQVSTHDDGESVADLRAQLAEEQEQRRLLIETNNLLARLLTADDREPLVALAGEGDGATAAAHARLGRRRALRAARPCALTDVNLKAFVYATVMTIDGSGTAFTDTTKFSDELGWQPGRTGLCFNPIFNLIDAKGCSLHSSAQQFDSLKTVGDMVSHVKTNTV